MSITDLLGQLHGAKDLWEEMAWVCVLKLYEESDALSENNCEDDFSGSDDNFLGFYDE
jgi:hypothetical protein